MRNDDFWLEDKPQAEFAAFGDMLRGKPGPEGKSAYQVAVDNGFVGTQQEWLASLKGDTGEVGKSAYQHAVDGGYTGTEEQFNEELAAYTQLTEDVSDLKSHLTYFDDIPGTVQTVNFGTDGNPSSIVHTANGAAVRTDTFTWGANTVTEKRELADGSYITFVTDLTTLVTTISEIQEA